MSIKKLFYKQNNIFIQVSWIQLFFKYGNSKG